MAQTSRPPLVEAKQIAVQAIASGKSVKDAISLTGRSMATWESWRKNDKNFAARVDRAREDAARRAAAPDDEEIVAPGGKISFAEFCETYLDVKIYPHQQAWVDVLEGRDPTLRPGWKWHEGNRNRLLINVPPGHSKSTVLTVFYTVYKICMDASTRVIIISETKPLADDFLHQIKVLLTDPRYGRMHAAYAPAGGFKGTANKTWNSNRIRVQGADEAATRKGAIPNKDATVEALGWGSQIYGRRADLIIMDDVATLGNAHFFEKQIKQINQDVASRLHGGKLLVVGTRVGAVDLYSELSNPDNFTSGRSPWTSLRQPAVSEFAPDPKDWVTLWPSSTTPYDIESEKLEDGTYAMFPGPKMAEIRDSMSAGTWALVYQQEDVPEDAIFSAVAVNASTNKARKPGPLTAGALGHPRHGGEGMYTVASMDPAMGQQGETFTLVGKVNRQDHHRYIENAWVQKNPGATYIIETIKRVTDEYGVNEWVIEENAFQSFLLGLPELRSFMSTRGIKITPHYTSRNKIDPDLGVASVAALFGTTRRVVEGGRWEHNGDNLIELPDPDFSPGIKTLKDELFTWIPGKRGTELRQDGPMALWFFELRARSILGFGNGNKPLQSFVPGRYVSRKRAQRRFTAPAHILEQGMG